MRRGGRLLYAFDVTNPASPVFLWKKTQRRPRACSARPGRSRASRASAGNSNPVLVFGAGYDAPAEDASTPGTTTMGNAVYVLDAISGSALKTFATTRSVPADVALIDSDFDGYIDRAYAVDLGGTLYRIDFESGSQRPAPRHGRSTPSPIFPAAPAPAASSSSAPTSS